MLTLWSSSESERAIAFERARLSRGEVFKPAVLKGGGSGVGATGAIGVVVVVVVAVAVVAVAASLVVGAVAAAVAVLAGTPVAGVTMGFRGVSEVCSVDI